MKLNIKATGISLNPEITNYLEKRLQSLNNLISDGNQNAMIDAELGRTTTHHQSGDIFRAEINLHTEGKSYRAVAEKENLNSAIDAVKDEMENILTKEKRKRLSLVRRGGQKVKAILRGMNPWRKTR